MLKHKEDYGESLRSLLLCAPGMGVIYRVQVLNGEGSSSH